MYFATLGQAVLASTLPGLAKTWSRAPTMGGQLVDAVAEDLDTLLTSFPALGNDLRATVDDMQRLWRKEISGPKGRQYHGSERLTAMASQHLLNGFVWDAFEAIQTHLQPAGIAAHTFRWTPDSNIKGCKADNTFIIDGLPVVVVEDKRLTDLPRVLEDIKTRASVLGDVEIKVTDKAPNQDWSTLVNKGALYQEVNQTEFVLSFGVTAVIVGYRTGARLLWSDPIYNRRDNGDEFELPNDPETIQQASVLVFGGVSPSQSAQTDLPLLFLAVMLKGAVKHARWLQQHLPSLCGLQFTAAAADLSFKGQLSQYLSTGFKKEDDEKAKRKRGADHDNSGDYSPTKRGIVYTQNTLSSASQSFAGRWHGELAQPAGYSVIISKYLSHGSHGVVYAGKLWKAGFTVSEVAIKFTEPKNILLEFARYVDLQDVMGHHIPRCYGVLIVDGGAFLVTELLESRETVHSAREREAVYEALSALHKAGWMHNDIVDGMDLRNLVWARSGDAVLIDLVTVTEHNCPGGSCEELEGARNILRLAKPRVII
ncbi:hypothetical protein B0H15DRAFT_829872 [Mycena belliarum]|uniref:Protein kinase domain-containing protein n=1 Tax=Mycena belliarum TaxID=1033014 RepID=A0AAD6U7X6_9AGAR|nr:hypothetical protein B0H15DRAFT_829872 [Mycena belliae]